MRNCISCCKEMQDFEYICPVCGRENISVNDYCNPERKKISWNGPLVLKIDEETEEQISERKYQEEYDVRLDMQLAEEKKRRSPFYNIKEKLAVHAVGYVVSAVAIILIALFGVKLIKIMSNSNTVNASTSAYESQIDEKTYNDLSQLAAEPNSVVYNK